MKNILFFLFFIVCNTYAQERPNYTKQGELPPTWLLNKVTTEQYRLLTEFSKYFDVDYTMFKKINLEDSDTSRFLCEARKLTNTYKDSEFEQKGSRCFSMPIETIGLHPYKIEDKDGTMIHTYIVYNSIDGYDAHIELCIEIGIADNPQRYISTNFETKGYSMSGLTVEADTKLTQERSYEPVNLITLGKDGVSNPYNIRGKIKFQDPLGNNHEEYIDLKFYLMFK